MQLKIKRDPNVLEGDYGAWDCSLWDGEDCVAAFSAASRDEAIERGRELVERRRTTEAHEEVIDL